MPVVVEELLDGMVEMEVTEVEQDIQVLMVLVEMVVLVELMYLLEHYLVLVYRHQELQVAR